MNDVPIAPVTPPLANARPHSLWHQWRNPWLLLAVLALALAIWQWIETRSLLADTQQTLARRLADSDASTKESRTLIVQTQAQLVNLQAKFGVLEMKLAESQSQQTTLENLYQELTRHRDESVLTEVEQSVSLAAQQLQLAANVQSAVLALQAADARLANSQMPQFTGLRKVLSRDLERLRALPQLDMPGLNLRLENVIAALDYLPLAMDARPRTEANKPEAKQSAAQKVQAKSAEHASPSLLKADFLRQPLGLAQAWATDFWDELRALIRIQRFDRDEPALLAPGQAFFLRENLKLRLLNARLALLAHDQVTFRTDLRQTQLWLERYFDVRQTAVKNAQFVLKQLAEVEIGRELPTLNESLSAIKNLKLAKERK
ncbi:MAG: uroporphyrinogen-III C-methyltransferase [Pseudomonadota bacterium]